MGHGRPIDRTHPTDHMYTECVALVYPVGWTLREEHEMCTTGETTSIFSEGQFGNTLDRVSTTLKWAPRALWQSWRVKIL